MGMMAMTRYVVIAKQAESSLMAFQERLTDGDGWQKPTKPDQAAILAGDWPDYCGLAQRSLLHSEADLAQKAIERDGNCFFAAARYCVLSTPVFTNDASISWLALLDGAVVLRQRVCDWMLEHVDSYIPQFQGYLIYVWVDEQQPNLETGTSTLFQRFLIFLQMQSVRYLWSTMKQGRIIQAFGWEIMRLLPLQSWYNHYFSQLLISVNS